MGKEKIQASETIKSEYADEREANGQQPFSDPEPHRELTEEEAEQVLDKLRAHEGIQRHGLVVEMAIENEQKIVKIQTPDGKVVKRFVERDLYFFLKQDKTEAIHLLSKSA